MSNKFLDLDKRVSSFAPINETIHHHDHIVLPGLLQWLELIKKGKFIYGISILLAVSIFFNVLWFKQKEKFEPGYYKFNAALFYSLDLEQLDSMYLKQESFVKQKVDSVINFNKNIIKINNELITIEKRRQALKKQLIIVK